MLNQWQKNLVALAPLLGASVDALMHESKAKLSRWVRLHNELRAPQQP